MKKTFSLDKVRLWWPAWQQSVPFATYIKDSRVEGHKYKFAIDKDMDSWTDDEGNFMPIADSALVDVEGHAVPFISFTKLPEGYVQVNNLIDRGRNEYSVWRYLAKELFFLGEAYSLEE